MKNERTKPRVTYDALRIVWIEVRGEENDDEYAAYPVRPRDGGLVGRLLAFLGQAEIYRVIFMGHSGGGRFGGGFEEADAKKVIAWLRKEGCECAGIITGNTEERATSRLTKRWSRTPRR